MINRVKRNGISFTGLLTVLFIGLKLGGLINWSWLWVLAPLWGGLALGCIIFVILAVVFTIILIRTY